MQRTDIKTMCKHYKINIKDLADALYISIATFYRMIDRYDAGQRTGVRSDVLYIFDNIAESYEKNELPTYFLPANKETSDIMAGNVSFKEKLERIGTNVSLANRLRLDNPHAEYLNISYLTPEDKYMNGTQIEDRSDEMDDEKKIDLTDWLRQYRNISGDLVDFMRTKVDDKNAWYSDPQRTFITHFNGVEVEDNYLRDFKKARMQLEFISSLLDQAYFTKCPLDEVRVTAANVKSCIKDLKKIETFEDPYDYDGIMEVVNELNEQRSMNRLISSKIGWYLSVYIVSKGDRTFMKWTTNFVLDPRQFGDIEEEDTEGLKVLGLQHFGPFTESLCKRRAQYVETDWEELTMYPLVDEVKSSLKWLDDMKAKKILGGPY